MYTDAPNNAVQGFKMSFDVLNRHEADSENSSKIKFS